LVTKNMWFNGTALSAQARRALENERVTMVSHETGHIHSFYDEATIDRAVYDAVSSKLRSYLKAQLTPELFGTFLRQAQGVQKCFQVRWMRHGIPHYIAAERVFAYELGSPYRLTDNTREKLLAEIDSEELMHDPMAGRLILDDLEVYIKENQIDLDSAEDLAKFKAQFCDGCLQKDIVIEELMKFLHVKPRLPDPAEKTFASDAGAGLGIHADMTREELIEQLDSIRGKNRIADLAFYAWRDLSRIDPYPFVLAGIERNPVSVVELADSSDSEVAATIAAFADESIYDGPHRLAQPDEVWNYGRGDGIEKALLLANVLYAKDRERPLKISISGGKAVLQGKGVEYEFASSKELGEQEWLIENMRAPYVGAREQKKKE
jgi:hypothetical protein